MRNDTTTIRSRRTPLNPRFAKGTRPPLCNLSINTSSLFAFKDEENRNRRPIHLSAPSPGRSLCFSLTGYAAHLPHRSKEADRHPASIPAAATI